MRCCFVLSLVLSVLLFATPNGVAGRQTSTTPQATIKQTSPSHDWPGFCIECDGLIVFLGNPSKAQKPLYQKEIIADAARQLKEAGLRPLTQAEAEKELGQPTLSLGALASRTRLGDPLYAYFVSVSLYEQATLERKPGEKIPAATSERMRIGTVKPDELPQIRQRLHDLVSTFIHNYRKQHPKQLPKND